MFTINIKGNQNPRNKELVKLELIFFKRQNIAENWDADDRIWTPVELSHSFDEQLIETDIVKVRFVSQMIDFQITKFRKRKRKRIKNGVVEDCSLHAKWNY